MENRICPAPAMREDFLALTDALSEFERRRNEVERAFYDFTYEQATLEPPEPGALELLAAIYRSQQATDAFLGLFAQTTTPADFFSQANVAKLMEVS